MSNFIIGTLDDSEGRFSSQGDGSTATPYTLEVAVGGNSVDETTGSMVITTQEHHEIHEENHYFLENYQDVGSGVSLYMTIVTPDTTKWAHMVALFSSEAEAYYEVYEGAAAGTGGSVLTARNNNRNSENTSGLVITLGVTPGATGTLLFAHKLGSGTNPSQSSPGESSRGSEIILAQDTIYLVKMTSGAADNAISYRLSWYEHTNK